MTQTRRSRGNRTETPAPNEAVPTTTSTSTVTDPTDDVHAWSGVFLNDGRMISLAWLRGWPRDLLREDPGDLLGLLGPPQA